MGFDPYCHDRPLFRPKPSPERAAKIAAAEAARAARLADLKAALAARGPQVGIHKIPIRDAKGLIVETVELPLFSGDLKAMIPPEEVEQIRKEVERELRLEERCDRFDKALTDRILDAMLFRVRAAQQQQPTPGMSPALLKRAGVSK